MVAPAAPSFLNSAISALIPGLTSAVAEKLVLDPLGQALGPTSYQTANPQGKSIYFNTAGENLATAQYLQRAALTRALWSLIPGLSERLPELPTREDIVGGFRDGEFTGAAALKEAQARSLTEREIEKKIADRQFDLAIQLAQAQAGVERQRLQSAYDAQARVEAQKVTSLGDVQRQRVQSQYQTAGDLLDSAIKNIAFRDKIEIGNTLQELARAV
jgi:hypothetical protein